MAQARQVKVGQTWTARISKRNVKVQVLAERSGAGGRKQFQIKNLDSGRTSSKWWGAGKLKTLVLDAPVMPAPNPIQAPAGPPPVRRKARTRKAPARRRPARTHAPAAEPDYDFQPQDPFEAEEHYMALGSLRGRPRAPTPAPVRRPAPRPQARQHAPQSPQEYPSALAQALCEAIKSTRGSEHEIRDAMSRTMAMWRFRNPPSYAQPAPPPFPAHPQPWPGGAGCYPGRY